MSDFSAIAAYGAGQLLTNQNESAAAEVQRKARQGTQKGTSASSTDTVDSDPVDTIQTSPAAGAALSALLKQTNAESQKQFDAEQLKEALTELHLLQLLGTSLPADQLAKETTDLAKRIAGIAQDYAGNSVGSTPAAVASATDPATTDANNAASSTQTADSTQSATAGASSTASTASTASSAGTAATPPATTAAATTTDAGTPSAKTASGQTTTAAGSTAPAASTSSTSTQSTTSAGAASPTAAAAGTDQGTDSAAAFFGQIIAAFKDLKKIETRALAELSLDKDPKKRNLAKKYGAEFNDAVLSTQQSAAAAGVPAPQLSQDTIDVATTTLNISV